MPSEIKPTLSIAIYHAGSVTFWVKIEIVGYLMIAVHFISIIVLHYCENTE